jgi:DNA-binding NarL/FixJ family response regulator
LENTENSSQKKIRIVIVDDHPVVRHGLAQIIAQDADMHVCAEAEDAAAGLAAIKQHRPDIAIIDLSLKDISGLELIKWVKELDFNVFMLVISIHDESIYAERALKAGAHGYLMKQETPDNIIKAIYRILEGEVYVSDFIVKRVVRRFARGHAGKGSVMDSLSDRELEVFQLIGKGYKPKQIADKLCLSVKTIETYQSNLKQKLMLGNASDLTQYAIQWLSRKE